MGVYHIIFFGTGLLLNGNPLGQNSFISSVASRAIDDSEFIAIDMTLNQGGLNSYTISHSNSSARFSGYLIGIADRESYCVPVGVDLPMRYY